MNTTKGNQVKLPLIFTHDTKPTHTQNKNKSQIKKISQLLRIFCASQNKYGKTVNSDK